MVDYYVKYQNQMNGKNIEFEKYIDIYYSNNDKFKRKKKNDYLILYNDEQLIQLKKSKYVNLYKEYDTLAKEKNIILSNIDILLNDNKDVEELKDELMNINKSLESISFKFFVMSFMFSFNFFFKFSHTGLRDSLLIFFPLGLPT